MRAFRANRDSAEFQRTVRPTSLLHKANKMPLPLRLVCAGCKLITNASPKPTCLGNHSIGGVKFREWGKSEASEAGRADRTDGPGGRGNWTFCQETTERALRDCGSAKETPSSTRVRISTSALNWVLRRSITALTRRSG